MVSTRAFAAAVLVVALPAVSAGEQRASGYGWTVAVTHAGPVAGKPLALYEVRSSKGDGRTVHVNKFESPATAIEHVRVHNPQTLAVIGRLSDRVSTLWIVDLNSGVVVLDTLCRELRLSPQEDRYTFADVMSTTMKSVSLTRRSNQKTMGSIEGTVKLLLSSRPEDRLRALDAVATYKAVSSHPHVRAAVAEALVRSAAADATAAAAQAGTTPEGIRVYSVERQILGRLLGLVAASPHPSVLETIVAIDHLSVAGAVAAYGPSAIRPIEDALARPAPEGYSPYYQPTLIDGLKLIATRYALGSTDRQRIVQLAATLLDRPASWRALNAALWLAHDLDDDRLDQKVSGFLYTGELNRLGITEPEGLQEIGNTVYRILSRRVTIR